MWRSCSGAVDQQLGRQPGEAVLVVGDRHVVPGAEVLDLHPRLPAGRERALGAAGLQLLRVGLEFRPGLRRLVGEAGLLERVLVVIEDRRRRVERHRQHATLGVAVIEADRRDVGGLVEGRATLFHDLVDRLDRAVRRHQRLRADLEHLHDRRRVAGAKRRDRRRQRLRVLALVDRDDPVVLLLRVEVVGDLRDQFSVRRGHRVPPLDLGHRMGGDGGDRSEGHHHGKSRELHGVAPE